MSTPFANIRKQPVLMSDNSTPLGPYVEQARRNPIATSTEKTLRWDTRAVPLISKPRDIIRLMK